MPCQHRDGRDANVYRLGLAETYIDHLYGPSSHDAERRRAATVSANGHDHLPRKVTLLPSLSYQGLL